jgi:hypothetical protein
MIEQTAGVTRVLARDQVHFFQNSNGTECDVFEITDGSRDKKKGSAHVTMMEQCPSNR